MRERPSFFCFLEFLPKMRIGREIFEYERIPPHVRILGKTVWDIVAIREGIFSNGVFYGSILNL